MKRILKLLLAPIRKIARPFQAKVESRLTTIVRASVRDTLNEEIVVVLDGLVTEVYRLQRRVDELSRTIEERDAVIEWNESASR